MSPPLSDPVAILRQRFAAAGALAFPGVELPEPAIAASTNPKFGDFQCNSAMTWAKTLGSNPRAVAAKLVETVKIDDLAEPLTAAAIAGPGFINITLKADALAGLLTMIDTPDLGLPVDPATPAAIVDLCGVNLAKQMHIGHLRSTVIGDTLARVLERLGGKARVTRQNHVGDWGLPIAMVTAKLMEMEAAGKVDLGTLTLDELDRIYKQAKEESDTFDEQIALARAWGMGPKIVAELEAANAEPSERRAVSRATLVKLQSGDPVVRRVWKRLYDITMGACLATCKRLNADVTEAHSAGESFYEDKLAPLVADLVKRAVAVADQGALVIRLDEFGIAEPLLIRKSDGGFLYATTDLAGIQHRVQNLKAQRLVYCVDARQSLHFRQVFAGSTKAGLAIRNGQTALMEHAAFGTILGEDGRPFKSRSGESVKLGEVIDEAEQRAQTEVLARNPDLPAAERTAIARAVAVAAIRYTDLGTERTKDYVFSLDRMVKFEGNTGPYLLYALVRIRSIFRKAEGDLGAGTGFVIAHPAEKALALALLRYPETVRVVGQTLEPSRLCQYLYDLAGAFSTFFAACPVLAAESPRSRAARLRLCGLTERVLAEGLGLLGIPTIERM